MRDAEIMCIPILGHLSQEEHISLGTSGHSKLGAAMAYGKRRVASAEVRFDNSVSKESLDSLY